MNREVRLWSAHLVGSLPLSASLAKNEIVAYPILQPGAWPRQITLRVAEIRDHAEATPRRCFKIKLADVDDIRLIRGFEENPAFRHYDKDDLLLSEVVAERS